MRRKGVSYAKYGYLFSVPFVLAFLIFNLYPTIYTAVIGFTDLKGILKTDFKFLDDIFFNFKLILKNQSFQQSFKNTIGIWIANFIPQVLLALVLAAWFTDHRRKIKGAGFFKVIFYMPNIITAASVAILFATFFGYPTGPVNDILMKLGLTDSPIYLLRSKTVARGVVAFVQFWMWYGYTMIILVSGILGINPELYESAEIDGANGRQRFFRITLPNLRTILVFTLVTSLIGGLNMYDIPRLFQNGGPDNSTLTTSVFIHNQAFSGSYLFNRAAAASMIMFVIIVACSSVVFLLMRDKDAAKQRKEEKAHRKEMKKLRLAQEEVRGEIR